MFLFPFSPYVAVVGVKSVELIKLKQIIKVEYKKQKNNTEKTTIEIKANS